MEVEPSVEVGEAEPTWQDIAKAHGVKKTKAFEIIADLKERRLWKSPHWWRERGKAVHGGQ